MICKECFEEIGIGKNYCTKCGALLGVVNLQSKETVDEYFESELYETIKQKEEKQLADRQREWEEDRNKRREASNQYAQIRDKLTTVRCPYCHSSNYSYDKKGFSSGKAIAGAAVIGPYGLLAGAVGSNKRIRFCNACGKSF